MNQIFACLYCPQGLFSVQLRVISSNALGCEQSVYDIKKIISDHDPLGGAVVYAKSRGSTQVKNVL